MGFGYGIWLIPTKHLFKTSHIAHVTITCFMNKNDAITLFHEISCKLGKNFHLNLIKKSKIYDKRTYHNEKELLLAWGYDCVKPLNWDILSSICKNYTCNFSYFPHISMEYSYNRDDFIPFDCVIDSIDMKLCVADINDDNPNKWKLLELNDTINNIF